MGLSPTGKRLLCTAHTQQWSFNRQIKTTTYSVATGRSWHSADGERHEETEWFNVVAWGSLAEICNQYLRKGQQVFVEGRLHTRRWEDSEGRKHFATELVAREMIMLGEPRDIAEATFEAAPDEEEAHPFQ